MRTARLIVDRRWTALEAADEGREIAMRKGAEKMQKQLEPQFKQLLESHEEIKAERRIAAGLLRELEHFPSCAAAAWLWLSSCSLTQFLVQTPIICPFSLPTAAASPTAQGRGTHE
eukprot:COSAG06_NODE_204_length_20326_cov_8.096060_16_plen_116_part_00